ncbi:MAG TPA: TolC family protein [Terriglobales bacterium]|jgi:outer membrane protein TolC|nr:TolC family protein [Terriglobales bacterium]
MLSQCVHISRASCRQCFVALAICLLLSGVAAAQNQPPVTAGSERSLPTAIGTPLRVTFPGVPSVPGVKADNAVQPASSRGAQGYTGGISSTPQTGNAPAGVRRITLEEAQEAAAAANNPLVRLGQLSVEAAKEHRLGVQGLYFPNVGTQFANLHLNKETGQVITVQRPLPGMPPVEIAANIFAKNQTDFNVAAAQPVTPLLSIYQLVKIARADENIAKAKAGLPVAEVAAKVEKNYFDLLVALRELTSAEADARTIQTKWLTASISGTPITSPGQETEMLGAEKAVVFSTSKVKELTAALNGLVGLPDGTTLELVPPEPLVEDTSLIEATEKATAANPEVIEAEQTAVKAHAGLTLTKLQYVPTVAITGGYANQNAISNRLLPKDFSYIGVIATYTIFDGFKREHGVKELKAQSEMADLGVQLTKAKVAAGVKSSYFELDRSRQLYQLARRMVSSAGVVNASYKSDDPEVESAKAKMEADMFRAELEYRLAYAKLKDFTGTR